MTIYPYCRECGWRKGGPDSWDGKACMCGHSGPVMPEHSSEKKPEEFGDWTWEDGCREWNRNAEKWKT